MRNTLVYMIFILAVVGLGLLSGLNNLPGEWYQSLHKPAFNPPDWVFGPVWTTLYVMIGVAGALLWIIARHSLAMKLWFTALVLNLLWSPGFFGLQSLIIGMAIIIPLLISIYVFMMAAWRVDRPVSILFWPYALWVSFATLLNGSLIVLNQ